ncbi:MAG: porin family protein [Muribaculaceae bacterium]|nr:porin family protein [Muribaculaceae bacterium]
MKRFVLLLFISLIGISAHAEEEDFSIGLNLGFGTDISNLGIGPKVQYCFTDAIRAELALNYFFKKDYTSMLDINLNAHYLFRISDKFNLYPLAGIYFTHITTEIDIFGDRISEWDEKLGINLGGGAEYKITNAFALDFEAKYQLLGINQAVISLGATYIFSAW